VSQFFPFTITSPVSGSAVTGQPIHLLAYWDMVGKIAPIKYHNNKVGIISPITSIFEL
jgi:hypothetical protein